MPKTDEMPASNLSDLAIMLIGEPGSGKTKFLASLPKPIYVFDFDKGIRTLRGETDIEYDLYRDGPFGMDKLTGDDLYKWGHGWDEFMHKLVSFSKDCPFNTIALDTVTFAQQLAKNAARRRHPSQKNGPEAMEIQHWGEVSNMVGSALDVLISFPCVKVVTAHVKRDVNPLNENVEFVPLIDGNMQGRIAGYFDEVYYTNRKNSADKTKEEFTLQTKQSGLYKSARTRIGVKDGSPLHFNSIMQAVAEQPVLAVKTPPTKIALPKPAVSAGPPAKKPTGITVPPRA